MNNNVIEIIDGDKVTRVDSIEGVAINFKGKNSVVRFKKPLPRRTSCRFDLGDDCLISFDSSNRYINNLTVDVTASHSRVTFGLNFSCYRTNVILSNEPGLSITFGDNCIVASGVIIRATDAHSIIDKSTGNVINHGKSISIGNHVWIAANVTILKGVSLSDWTVVGACALVTKSFDEQNCVIAGNPAKVLKRGIVWDCKDPYVIEHALPDDGEPSPVEEVGNVTNYKVVDNIFSGSFLIEESSNIWNSVIVPLPKQLTPNSCYKLEIETSNILSGDFTYFQLSFKDNEKNKAIVIKNIFVGCHFELFFKTSESVPNLDIKFYPGEAGQSNNKSIEIKNINISKISIIE